MGIRKALLKFRTEMEREAILRSLTRQAWSDLTPDKKREYPLKAMQTYMEEKYEVLLCVVRRADTDEGKLQQEYWEREMRDLHAKLAVIGALGLMTPESKRRKFSPTWRDRLRARTLPVKRHSV